VLAMNPYRLSLSLAFLLLPAPLSAQFRTIDGSGNNPTDPAMGQAGAMLLRTTTSAYGDGLSTPSGAGRPGARALSNALAAQTISIQNEVKASDFLWQWGQFIDHDIDLSSAAEPAEPLDIPVPAGDPWFDPFGTGSQVIPFARSVYRVDALGMRQQVNRITAFLDGSMVYGSDGERAMELRALDGFGRLKTGAKGLLPFNVNGLENAGGPSPELFLAGDIRANEQLGLTAMHTLFVREHNFWARVFRHFAGTGEELSYQLARRMVGAEIQAITYNEFLPMLLGPNALPPYRGYDPSVDPGIENAFSSVAFRVGHTMLNPELLRLGPDMHPIAAGNLPLADAFFNPGEIVAHGIEPLLRGMAMQRAQRVDMHVVDTVRNFLFGPPGAGGMDLAALNIQRGRDHGMPDYNRLRMDYGLAPRRTFAEISSDRRVAAALERVYGSVDAIDPWVGALAEDHVRGALVGELVRTILIDQFTRLRDGDSFWYQISLAPPIVRLIGQQSLCQVIRRNSRIRSEIQADVFRTPNRLP